MYVVDWYKRPALAKARVCVAGIRLAVFIIHHKHSSYCTDKHLKQWPLWAAEVVCGVLRMPEAAWRNENQTQVSQLH